MIDERIINNVISLVLNHDVKPGDHAGGSGHLSYVSYTIKEVIKEDVHDNILKIKCLYDTIIVTEFTLEPHNPPYIYNHEKKIMLIEYNNGDKVPSDFPVGGGFERQIIRYVDYYLLRIEQGYGDCRAPVKFPPYFHSEKREDIVPLYYAFIDVDLGEDETMAFVSTNPSSILTSIKKVFKDRFGFAF
jgi:hypothetical protein